MKAIKELEREGLLWYTGLEEDPDSYWYLGPGVKIEQFRDGRVELKYTYTVGERFYDMSASDTRYFEEYGWFAGLARVNIDYWNKKLAGVEASLTSDLDDCERRELYSKRNHLIDVIEGYRKMLNSALKSEINSVSS